MTRRGLALSILACGILVGSAGAQEEPPMAMTVTSLAFQEGQRIPTPHTCDGADQSVPLAWTDPPAGTQSFAGIVDDPDAPAGIWVHWVIFNIPPDARQLPEHLSTDGALPDGTQQGVNDFGRLGYGGPCPPPGPAHHYVFKLYALDQRLSLPPKPTKAQLERAMQGHILAQAQLIGLYQR